MFRGYLNKRNTPLSPPQMQRYYCVLWGTLLLDFENEEEAKSSISPKCSAEVIGVHEWDGEERSSTYENGLLFVTHTGRTYYCCAPTLRERDEWILQVKAALECSFGNPKIIPFKPSKVIFPSPETSSIIFCAKTKGPLTFSAQACRCCGFKFNIEHLQESAPILQIGIEDSVKLCLNCKNSQMILLWLKCMNYVHSRSLHEQTPEVLREVSKYKFSFKLRKELSSRLQMASDLLDQGLINMQEFEELRKIDHDVRRSTTYETADKLCEAVMHLDYDMQTVLGILEKAATSDTDSIVSFQQLSFKCLEFADKSPNIFEFYLPQILQIHSMVARSRLTENSMRKIDCLQQVIVAICSIYPTIALKTIWSLISICSADYNLKRSTQTQYAASMSLLIQVELVSVGDLTSLRPSSYSTDTEYKEPLLSMSTHQLRDLFGEIGILFRVRHQLLVVYERERLIGKKISNDMKSQQYEVAATAPTFMSHEDRKRALQEELSALRPEEDCFLLSSDLSLKLIIPRTSCTNVLYSVGAVDASGSLLVLVNIAEKYTQEGDMRKFPKNILSFELAPIVTQKDVLSSGEDDIDHSSRSLDSSKGSTDLRDIDLNDVFQEANIRDPPPPFTCVSRSLGLAKQLRLVDMITSIVDDLRKIDRPLRKQKLQSCLGPVNELIGSDCFYDIIQSSEEPVYRLCRIFIDECRVFQTKARAPSLILCEVERLGSPHGRNSCDHLQVVSSSLDQSSSPNSPRRAKLPVYNDAEIQEILEARKSKTLEGLHEHERRIHEEKEVVEHDPPIQNLELNEPAYAVTNSSQKGRRDSLKLGSLLSSHRKSVPFLSILGVDVTSMTGQGSPGMSDAILKNLSKRLDLNTEESDTELEGDFEAVSSVVLTSAQKLLAAGKIDQREYDQLVHSDARFRGEEVRDEVLRAQLQIETCFGELWDAKKERLVGHDDSDDTEWPKRDLRCFIVKSNDDLRQEVCCLQVMALCNEIFVDNGLGSQLFLKPYRIISTGADTGFVEVLPNTISIDALKKTKGFKTLAKYFEEMYGQTPERLRQAKKNFSASLAACSLFCYILQVKDRHNGNMLISSDGHMMHIDFGFLLSIAPGGMLSLETAPFKLTEEMVDVLDGFESALFHDFVKAFTSGFIALKANAENIISIIKVLSVNSPFPCFSGKDSASIIDRIKQRFRSDLNLPGTVDHCLDLIIESYGHSGTRRYDSFQWYSNGIMP